jgi:hypothetical protein
MMTNMATNTHDNHSMFMLHIQFDRKFVMTIDMPEARAMPMASNRNLHWACDGREKE